MADSSADSQAWRHRYGRSVNLSQQDMGGPVTVFASHRREPVGPTRPSHPLRRWDWGTTVNITRSLDPTRVLVDHWAPIDACDIN